MTVKMAAVMATAEDGMGKFWQVKPGTSPSALDGSWVTNPAEALLDYGTATLVLWRLRTHCANPDALRVVEVTLTITG